MADLVHIAPVGRVAVASRTWRRAGQRQVTVMVKATYAFVPDGLMAPTNPLPVFVRELHNEDNPTASVCATSETAPFLQQADVVFRGAALVPGGEVVQKLSTRLAMARGSEVLFDKRLLVTGDRIRDAAGQVSEPEGFTRMPLVYDRAYGGIGNAGNPLGVGLGPSADGRVRLPNIENPAGTNQVEPAGYAPISASWAARRELLHGRARTELEQPEAEIPEGFDYGYFQSAPLDQRISFLQGDELLMLKRLTPQAPAVMTTLPTVRGEARASIAGGPPFAVELVADTLFVDGDEARCAIVWRGHFPVAEEVEVRCSMGVSMGGVPVVFPEVLGGAVGGPAPPVRPAPNHRPFGGTMLLEPESAPAPPQAAKNMGTMLLEVPEAPAADAPNRQATMLLEPEATVPATPGPVDHPLSGTMVLEAGPPGGHEASPLPFRSSDRPPAPRRSEPPVSLPGAPWAKGGAANVQPAPAIGETCIVGEDSPETERLGVDHLQAEPGKAEPPAALGPPNVVKLDEPKAETPPAPTPPQPAPEPAPKPEPKPEPKRRAANPAMKTSLYKKFGKS